MVHSPFRRLVDFYFPCLMGLGVMLWGSAVLADQVETVAGDRYVGRVVSLGSDTLVLQSEVLGTVKLPRALITTISLDARPLTENTNMIRSAFSLPPRSNAVARVAQAAPANANPTNQFNLAMKQLSSNSNVISQVQDQFLAGAGPEAQGKFNELVAGLLSGKLGVNDLRAQAKTTLDQARAAQKEMGDEGGSSLESYLSILEGFLKETAPAVDTTNPPVIAITEKTTVPKTDKDE